MSFFKDFLDGLGVSFHSHQNLSAQPSIFSEIENALESYPREEATFIAAVALLLGHMAYADLDISPSETQFMRELLQSELGLTPDKAKLVTAIAVSQPAWAGLEITKVWATIREQRPKAERKKIMHMAFQLAAFDGINAEESQALELMSRGLGFQHPDFIELKLEFKEHMTYKKL